MPYDASAGELSWPPPGPFPDAIWRTASADGSDFGKTRGRAFGDEVGEVGPGVGTGQDRRGLTLFEARGRLLRRASRVIPRERDVNEHDVQVELG